MSDGFARHTPVLAGTKVVRALSIDGALLASVGGALSDMASSGHWLEVGDSVDDVVAELMDAVESWYAPMNIGQIVFFIGALPDGWLAMDGTTYSGADYPELMEVIDGQFKNVLAGEFTLPDLGGLFPLVADSLYVLGDLGGATTVTLTTDQIPAHSHTYVNPVANVDLEAPGAPDILAAGVGPGANTGSTGGGNSHDNMPPYVALVCGVFSGRV